MRSIGVRDLVLGMIALHTLDHPEVGPRWQATCAVVDTVDLLATGAARKDLPAAGVAGTAAGGRWRGGRGLLLRACFEAELSSGLALGVLIGCPAPAGGDCHDGSKMLHDHARIHLQAGAGGDGSASFRREAHVPRGGPDGGDGGRGGDVVLVCDDSLRDLQSFRRRAIYRAGQGGHGEGSLRHGADGETLTIRVPPGTEAIGCAGPAGEDGDLRGAAGSC